MRTGQNKVQIFGKFSFDTATYEGTNRCKITNMSRTYLFKFSPVNLTGSPQGFSPNQLFTKVEYNTKRARFTNVKHDNVIRKLVPSVLLSLKKNQANKVRRCWYHSPAFQYQIERHSAGNRSNNNNNNNNINGSLSALSSVLWGNSRRVQNHGGGGLHNNFISHW